MKPVVFTQVKLPVSKQLHYRPDEFSILSDTLEMVQNQVYTFHTAAAIESAAVRRVSIGCETKADRQV